MPPDRKESQLQEILKKMSTSQQSSDDGGREEIRQFLAAGIIYEHDDLRVGRQGPVVGVVDSSGLAKVVVFGKVTGTVVSISALVEQVTGNGERYRDRVCIGDSRAFLHELIASLHQIDDRESPSASDSKFQVHAETENSIPNGSKGTETE